MSPSWYNKIMKKFGLPLLIAGIAGVMITIFAIGNKAAPVKPEADRSGAKHADQGQEHIDDGQQHAAYNSNLPTSGPHYKAPAPWGVKDGEVADETLIHNLEHGGIVIAYKADLDPKEVEKLKSLFKNLPTSQKFGTIKAILVPRAKNTSAIQLGAWTYTLDLNEVDGAKIRQFYMDHIDKGPELVP